MEASFFTFNVLAAELAVGFPECDPRHLLWAYRYPRILKIVKDADADVVILLEVSKEHVGDFQNDFRTSHPYSLFKCKRGRLSVDGTLLLVKEKCDPDRFISWAFPRSSQVVVGAQIQVGGTHSIVNGARVTTGGVYVSVFGFHLKAKSEHMQTRVDQMRNFFIWLEKTPHHESMVLMGDFNDDHESPVAGLMRTRGFVSANVNHIATTAKTRTFFLRREIDYIWVRCGCVKNFKQPVAMEKPGYPSAGHPSDHVPIEAVIDFGAFVDDVKYV